jgi:hypothetical protein
MTEKSCYGVPENVLKLSTTLAMSLHTASESQLLPVLTTLPPPTLDERSRELCACSTLLLWRAQRACENNCARGYNGSKMSVGSSEHDAGFSLSRCAVYGGSVRTQLLPEERGPASSEADVLTDLSSNLADADKDVDNASPRTFRYNKNVLMSARARIDGMRIEPAYGTFPGP